MVIFLEVQPDEAFIVVGVEFGVVADHLGDGDAFECGDLGLPRERLAVLCLQRLEPVDCVPGDVLDVVLYGLHLGLDGSDFLVDGLRVELGDLADRLLHELLDVLHQDFPSEDVLVGLHLGEHLVQLLLPAVLVLLQNLIDLVLEEYPFEGGVVPLVLQLGEPDLKLPFEKVSGVESVVGQYVLDGEELWLVVHDDAGVRRDVALTVREGVQGVDGLVRGHVVREMDENIDLLCGHVLDFLDLDLAFVLGLKDRVDEDVGCLPVRNLRDGHRVLVDFLNLCAHLHAASAGSVLVVAAVS